LEVKKGYAGADFMSNARKPISKLGVIVLGALSAHEAVGQLLLMRQPKLPQ
jgi:hypothetical protein